jgi:hypothetical protein
MRNFSLIDDETAINPIERFNSEAFFVGLYNRGFASKYGLSEFQHTGPNRSLASILLAFIRPRASSARLRYHHQ